MNVPECIASAGNIVGTGVEVRLVIVCLFVCLLIVCLFVWRRRICWGCCGCCWGCVFKSFQ